MQIKKYISGLPPRILLEPYSFWMGKSNHKKILHFLARPIIGPGEQTPHEKTINYTWEPPATADGPQINTRKGHASTTRPRARSVPSIHTVRKHQYCLLQDSGFPVKFIRIKQEGSQSHKAREISPYLLLTITTQTQSRR